MLHASLTTFVFLLDPSLSVIQLLSVYIRFVRLASL